MFFIHMKMAAQARRCVTVLLLVEANHVNREIEQDAMEMFRQ